ncbi:cysteine--1-D-myo-inosityl 2-amino-2-deoxy-alpha-D-glucopyranoside ligase [Demetria terragena]|uniref:cysteine--1-D-myo-inosityl 2-amino-2-deoxy-alpha-D-glucopyranoside ligase n=1 Tax=Demetria terragena TaxID=63959 RepID=UPI00036EDE4B|nr:cysteine--1-D-myo-inosityl 2-amino-2-deoxy-alpha-D-glucopyranoside ligase [Demetria terragena]
MKTWNGPALPQTPVLSPVLQLHDTASGTRHEVLGRDGLVRLYVCGITPYDATHMGHAATYLTFDLVGRAVRASGLAVRFAQNVTDVDDPLFERADRDGIDWRDLGAREVQLFRDDMTALRVIPPDAYVGVEESMPRHAQRVAELLDNGAAYTLPVPDEEAAEPGVRDTYLDLARQPSFGQVSGWSREQMLDVFAERGGDPDRPGKRDVLDPLLWRGARTGEPSWDGATAGPGRPGWHLECTTIALDELDAGFDVQGGGDDLIFPHHEMSAVQAAALPGRPAFAQTYVHQAMVAYDGHKMSKSLGNLVRVSDLRAEGIDPMAVRLVLLGQHYRTPWEWTSSLLEAAQARLVAWQEALPGSADAELVRTLGARLADDLDTPAAVAAVDAWVAAHPAGADDGSGHLVTDSIDALLGVQLRG